MAPKLIGFLGNPGSGKTTLACALKEYFMLNKITTEVSTEYAREFVYEYGFPEHPFAQFKLGLEQKHREDLLCKGKSKYVFSDSPVWLVYVFSLMNIAFGDSHQKQIVVADLYKEFVIKQIQRYHTVFYLKNDEFFDDGCKRDASTEKLIKTLMDSFVSSHEHILPIVRIDVPIDDTEARKRFVYEYLENNKNE